MLSAGPYNNPVLEATKLLTGSIYFLSSVPVPRSVVVSIIGALGSLAIAWLKNKIGNDKLSRALDELHDATWTAVQELEQTMRKQLKDGKLSDQEKARIKAEAVKLVKMRLTPAALKIATRELSNVNDWIAGQAEAMVMTMNLRKRENGA